MLCLLERLSQPVNINIVCKDATSLTLSWSKPANTNEETDYYIVSAIFLCIAYSYSYGIATSQLLLICKHLMFVLHVYRFTTMMTKQERQSMCTILLGCTSLIIFYHPHSTVFT